MILRDEILKGKEIPAELEPNLEKLLSRLNFLREVWGKPMVVTSGYRDPGHNAQVGGAPRSNHMRCLAADFADPDGALDNWCLLHLDVLESAGLWLESPDHTPGWCHLQAVAPKSGNRVFIP